MRPAKGVRAGHPELRKLQRRLKPGIYLVAQGKGGHVKLCNDKGLIRDERGMPITLASSPNARSIRNAQRMLQQLGLLT
jgi:hypothetical protein